MVWWKVTVRKIATVSNNVHINMCTKLSEKNCSQEWWRSGSIIFTYPQQYIHQVQHAYLWTWNIISCFVQIKDISGPFLWYKLIPSQISFYVYLAYATLLLGVPQWLTFKEFLNFKVPIITFMRASLVFPTDMSCSWCCCLKCTNFINLNKYKQCRSRLTYLTLEL